MAEVLQNVNEMWRRTSLMQRVVLIGIVLACIGATVLLVGWASQPKMAMLFSALHAEEAGKIVAKIEEQDVDYELRAGGTSIFVPAEKVHQLRLALAADGLPVGGGTRPGFKLLDEQKIGLSPFMQEKNYLRALEGEIARTIQMIDGVVSSRVHVVRPATSLLGGRDKVASASVVVQTRPNVKLDDQNVSAIVHLLAGSVEGLQPERVSVIDHTGKLLSGDEGDRAGGRANNALELRARWEDYFAEKIEAVLKPVLGPDRVAVRVDVELDMTSTEEMIEKAEEKGVTVEETIRESSSQQPAMGDNAGAGQPGGQERESETKSKFRPVMEIRKVVTPAGTIKSRHVAVVVDLTEPKVEGEEGENAPGPAAQAKIMSIEEVRKLVARAIGLGSDQKIEDTIEVVDRKFQGLRIAALAGPSTDSGNPMETYFEIARRSSLGVLVLGALVALRIFRGPRKKGSGDVTVTEEANALPAQASAGELKSARERISRALQENPDQVKQLFLSWAQAGSDEEA